MTVTVTPEQLAAAQKANVEALLTLATTALDSVERLVSLNINTVRTSFDEAVAQTKAVSAVKDPQELASLSSAAVLPVVEKSLAYSRQVYEIVTGAQQAVSKLAASQLAEINKNVASALDKLAESAPAGSDVAVAAVKSAIAAANSAYDQVTKAVKQVTEVAESNVEAATKATVQAIGAAAKTK